MTEESSFGYSEEELAEMKVIFDQHDRDRSGRLDATEFTKALQLMDYKYSVKFVIEVLKLVFDAEWENKKNNLLFQDFTDFMSEFEPVHYEVIDQIEAKLKEKSINDIDVGDARIVNLLQYAQMKNGGLLLSDIYQKLDGLKQTVISPLSTISENRKVSNAENNIANISNQDESKNAEEELLSAMQKTTTALNQRPRLLKMNNDALIQCINDDQSFSTTLIRKECIQTLTAQKWNGSDLIQALKLDKIDEVLLLFKNLENYEYIIESIKKLNTADIDYNELIAHLEKIKSQKTTQLQKNHPNLQTLGSMELRPPTPQTKQVQQHEILEMKQEQLPQSTTPRPTYMNRRLSVTSKTIIDDDDELYTQNVWKQILRFFDDNNDGTISVSEMGIALRSLGIDLSDSKLKDIIAKIDQDKSGTIDYKEFKLYYVSLFQEKIKKGLDWKYIDTIFQKYDSDSSGFLDIDEFSYALKRMCTNITDEDIRSILHLIDTSGDQQIEFSEFVDFLESGHTQAEWVVKKLIRSSIPTPIEYLSAFKGLPAHFRKSELAEISKRNSFRISERIKPQIDVDGITLKNVRMDPKTSQMKRKFKSQNISEDDTKQNDQYLQNMRIFKLTECSGVPLPEPAIASRIISRSIRLCLYSDNKPISNVFTIPASWRFSEEDQWICGSNIWKDIDSKAISEWNTFCVAIPENTNGKTELFVELCVTMKPPANPLLPMPNMQQAVSPNKSQMNSPSKGMQQSPHKQSAFSQNYNNANIKQSEIEMSCGWTKLEIHKTNINVSHNGINRSHKLKIHGGSFNSESGIKSDDVRNSRKSSLSFRKLKQALSSIESVVKIQEQSYNNTKNSNKDLMKWIPENVITTISSCKIIKLYYQIMADHWFTNRQIFDHQFLNEQNLYQTLLLFIIDRPNLLCMLMDEWTLKKNSYWRSQRNDDKFINKEFQALLKQFVPLLVHQELSEKHLTSLNQQRLRFTKQIIKGNVKHILAGNKPSSLVPVIYTPFNSEIFIA